MKKTLLIPTVLAALCLGGWQSDNGVTLDDASLNTTLEGLGYTTKDLGEGLYEITISESELDIPMRAFLAKSKLKVWLSVTLMLKDKVATLGRDDLQKYLERTVDCGPAHFMIENGAMKLKLPFDNRNLTSALFRKEILYLKKRVLETRDLWQK